MKQVVLVLSSERNSPLFSMLSDLNYEPLPLSSIGSAVGVLPSKGVALILVDFQHTEVDSVEFVMNVRDVDPRTPIVFVGAPARKSADSIWGKLPRTFKLPEPKDASDLAVGLANVISAASIGSS